MCGVAKAPGLLLQLNTCILGTKTAQADCVPIYANCWATDSGEFQRKLEKMEKSRGTDWFVTDANKDKLPITLKRSCHYTN